MCKRVTAFVLSMILLLTLLPMGVVSAQAASELEASDQCVDMLKQMEGFAAKPYWDYGQWTVGYGTKCPDDKYDEYAANGISEEEAEELLRTYLKKFSDAINAFNDAFSLDLTQNQFDALILFTYNCGTRWISSDGEFRNAVTSKATGNDFIYPITLWCSAGDDILPGLITRRLIEANMYLNGEYSTSAPSNYGYIRYNANGGTVEYRIQGYDTNQPTELLMTPTFAGYTFDGWYTARKGGYQVTMADANTKNMTLYARWLDADGNVVETPFTSTPITPITVTVQNNSVNLREGPGTDYAGIGKANKGDTFTVTAIAYGSGYAWGQYDGGWIALTYTNYDSLVNGSGDSGENEDSGSTNTPAPPAQEPETVIYTGMVTSKELKVRAEPTASSSQVGTLKRGDTVEITRTKQVESETWGKTKTGWVNMYYILLDDISSTPLHTGTIVVDSDELNVRQGPGFSYDVVGSLKNGDRVEIVQVVTAEDHTWGRTGIGWFSMKYFKEDLKVLYTGTVTVEGDELNVREGPGLAYTQIATIPNGTKVNIYETKDADERTWGRVDEGWVSMEYIVLDGSEPEEKKLMGTVNTDELNIREEPGINGGWLGYYYKGDRVEILEQKDNGGLRWGRTEKGWICMDYVDLDEQKTSGFTDVSATAYYADAVAWAVQQGITTGKTATTFQPSEPCTRAQVAAFLWRANGKPAVEAANPFTDVPAGKYYTDAVLWAVEQGITTGKTADTFQPDAGCTRAQVVTFLWRAAGEPAPKNTENPFTDVHSDAYYYNAVLWAVEQGITTGKTADTFLPTDTCTRAQIVTFLYRALAK